MKKIVIVIIVILIIALGAWFLSRGAPASNNQETSGTTGTLPSVATGTEPYAPPTGPTLTIGTSGGSVTMNNFYNTAKRVSVDHTAILIQETDAYNITYDAVDSSFNILITQTPFSVARAQAEAAFLKVLGISQADACKLDVRVGTMYSVDPQLAGQNFGLSFCPNSLGS